MRNPVSGSGCRTRIPKRGPPKPRLPRAGPGGSPARDGHGQVQQFNGGRAGRLKADGDRGGVGFRFGRSWTALQPSVGSGRSLAISSLVSAPVGAPQRSKTLTSRLGQSDFGQAANGRLWRRRWRTAGRTEASANRDADRPQARQNTRWPSPFLLRFRKQSLDAPPSSSSPKCGHMGLRHIRESMRSPSSISGSSTNDPGTQPPHGHAPVSRRVFNPSGQETAKIYQPIELKGNYVDPAARGAAGKTPKVIPKYGTAIEISYRQGP